MVAIFSEHIETLNYSGYSNIYNNNYDITQPLGIHRSVEEGTTFIDESLTARIINVNVPAKKNLIVNFLPRYFDEYYNRIIVTPSIINLKTITTEITEDFYIWNAYIDSSKTMSNVTAVDTDGLSIGGLTVPTTFLPNSERLYEISAILDGPANIDATFSFVFPDDLPVLGIVGQRLLIWHFTPQIKMKEILEWKTNILQSFEGEQRIALREVPRQEVQYNYILTDSEYSEAKAISRKWSGNNYGVPIWSELSMIGDITAGDYIINMDTTIYDYYVDGFIYIWDSNENNISAKIIEITDTTITVKYPLPEFSNALAMPLKKGINKTGIKFSRGGYEHITMTSDFLIVNDRDIDPFDGGLGYPEYLESEVVTNYQIALSGISEVMSRAVDYFDNGQGIVVIEKQIDYAKNRKMITMWSDNAKDRWNNKAWLYTKKGKQKKFWIISWNRDIKPVEDILVTSSSIVCEHMNYELYREISYIAIIKKDGTMLFNTILSATPHINGEGLLLENTLPYDVNVDEIDRISFMTLVRFDSDKVTIENDTGMYSSTKIPVMEIPE